MPLNTFAPSIAPSPGTKHSQTVNLNEAKFGDGYTQSSPQGINHIQKMMTLSWGGLTETQMIELNSFFEDRGGYRPFYFQPRGFPIPLKWTCKVWSISDASPWRFEAKLEQNYTTEV